MSIARWTALEAGITAIAGSSLNALTNASYALGAEIDPTGSGDRWLHAGFRLVFRDGTPADTTVTAGSGSPFLAIWILPAWDGTRYPTTNGGTTAGPTSPQYLAATIQVPASTAVGVIVTRAPLILPPCKFKVMIQNNLGVTFPSTNNALCDLYEFSAEAV